MPNLLQEMDFLAGLAMSADDAPRTKTSLLTAPLMLATRIALRFPVTTIALGIGLALACMWVTTTRLGYRTSRLDLLDPNSDYNRLWIDYINEFGDEDDAVVVVEGPNRDKVVPVLQEIAAHLGREDRLFHAVLHGVDLNKIRAKGLHYLPSEELRGVERFLGEAGPILDGQWARLNLGNMATGMAARLQMVAASGDQSLIDAARQEVDRLTDSLLTMLSQKKQYVSPWPGMPSSFATLSELSSEYLVTNEGKLGFVLLRLSRGEEGFARCSEAVDALRDLIEKVEAHHPGTRIGLTGLPVMENDEMRSSQSSMYSAGLISFVGVAILFVAGFGGVRHALLANGVLLLGMAWAFGFVTMTVGHLNILSVSFTSTLIGIGIDYGIHYVARYLQLVHKHRDTKQTLLATSSGVGSAILTGALTTAVAFFAAGFTSFTGVAELGIIAGAGVLICCIAELLILPAVMLLVDRRPRSQTMPEPLAVHLWIEPLLRNPRRLLLSTGLFTALVSLGVTQLWYDHNLLNLQADGLESVELEQRLLTECNQSVWYAVSIADSREELLARKEQLLKLDSVERTEEIVSLLPADHEIKKPIIARIQTQLATMPERPPLIPVDKPEELGRALAQLEAFFVENHYASSARRIEQVRDALRRLPLSDCYAMLSYFQQQMAGDLLSRLYMLRGMADPEPPQLTDLPEGLVHRFVGQHDRHLLKIYGRGNIWDMAALERFVYDVRSVDPRATGNPLQAYEASHEMKGSYEKSAFYAMVIVLSLLWIDFRSLKYAILAALPLTLGLLQTFGIMGLLNVPLNPANMIALPLMLGIGVDYGVHIIHDFREQKGRFKLAPSTAVAVLVDSLTTIVGFGAMMVASHRGLQSLGRVLTIGVSCCLFTSLVMLPALLAWMSWNRKEDESVDDEPSERPFVGSSQVRLRRDPVEPSTKPPHVATPQR
ncbi:MAG TPA: MMPL family transporter, partial [Pirellulales bacterium]|nr:MMPL family transporter [Pirellulales bacterium]